MISHRLKADSTTDAAAALGDRAVALRPTIGRKPFRLVLVMATLGPGGAERILSMLANRWAERGLDVTIVTLEQTGGDFYPLSSSICRVAVPSAVSGRESAGRFALAVGLLRRAAALRRAIKKINPDAVLSFIDSTNVMMLLSLIGTRVPRVVSERSDPAMVPLAWLWRILRAVLYPSADRLVVQTEGAAKFFSGRAARRLAIIPNPVVRPALHDQPGFEPSTPVIMSLGRFTEEKRFDDLLDAFAMIAPRHPAWSLMIAGDGPLRAALMERVRTLGLDGRVLLPGLVKSPAHLLKHCDIYVLSSRFEGFPNAMCEAMALGRPVVATDCPSGPRAIVRDGIDGILVPPMQPTALAEALERLIRSPGERDRLGAAAATITDRFQLDPIVDAWESVLRSAIEARR